MLAHLDSSHRFQRYPLFEDIIFREASTLHVHCLENTGGEVGLSRGARRHEFFSRLDPGRRWTMRAIGERGGENISAPERYDKCMEGKMGEISAERKIEIPFESNQRELMER